MKKIFMLIAAIAFVSSGLFAQKNKKDATPTVKPDEAKFKWEQSKLVPKMKKLAISELTVTYKLTTTAKVITQEKSSRNIGGARVTAFLETTDGDLTENDFQEITDHFYAYFQKKLKAGGIDTVGWNTVTATDFYQKISVDEEKADDEAKEKKGGNEWVTSTANKGKIVHSGMAGFAGGKGKRSVEFVEELDAYAASFKVNVDFADVQVGLDIKTRQEKELGGGWYIPAQTKMTYTWAVKPEMRVGDQELNQKTLLWSNKGWPEYLMQWNDIPVEGIYADSMTEDPSKARGGIAKQFAFRKELTPFLIQTTREKYKAAATHAVEKWADAFVARVVQMRKS